MTRRPRTSRATGRCRRRGSVTCSPATSRRRRGAPHDAEAASGPHVAAPALRATRDRHPRRHGQHAAGSSRPGCAAFLVARDGTCRTPWCDAPVRHSRPRRRPSRPAVPTSAANGQGPLRALQPRQGGEPGGVPRLSIPARRTWSRGSGRADDDDGVEQPHTVEITTPTGHRYRSSAPPVLLPAPSPVASSPSTAPEVDVGRPGAAPRVRAPIVVETPPAPRRRGRAHRLTTQSASFILGALVRAKPARS